MLRWKECCLPFLVYQVIFVIDTATISLPLPHHRQWLGSARRWSNFRTFLDEVRHDSISQAISLWMKRGETFLHGHFCNRLSLKCISALLYLLSTIHKYIDYCVLSFMSVRTQDKYVRWLLCVVFYTINSTQICWSYGVFCFLLAATKNRAPWYWYANSWIWTSTNWFEVRKKE